MRKQIQGVTYVHVLAQQLGDSLIGLDAQGQIVVVLFLNAHITTPTQKRKIHMKTMLIEGLYTRKGKESYTTK